MSTETSSWDADTHNTLALSKHSRSSLTPLTEIFVSVSSLKLRSLQVWESERDSRTYWLALIIYIHILVLR
jgi:hypothetical protein